MATIEYDIITEWLESNQQAFSNPEVYVSFNSYLISEFGITQATKEETLIKRYALLCWLEFHKQGFVCIEIADVLNPTLAMSGLFRKLNGTNWDLDTLLNVLSDLSFKDGFESFVVEEGRLYMKRHLTFENEIVSWLKNVDYEPESYLANRRVSGLELADYRKWIIQEFSTLDTPKKQILTHLFSSQFIIVTGGPGTGKTYTLERIMKVYHQWFPDLRIQLAAPTGKAAKRMNESIDTGLLELYGEAMTIHRMLGARHDGSFSKGVKNRLNSDIIIIDEASMIDIDLFIQIIRACKEGSQLILVGDRFQLDSVEAGNILGDLCAHKPNVDRTSYGVFELETNYRQKSSSSIPDLSLAIKNGDWASCRDLLTNEDLIDVVWQTFNPDITYERNGIRNYLLECAVVEFSRLKSQLGSSVNNPGNLDSHCLLGAVRQGWLGIEPMNEFIDHMIRTNVLSASVHSDSVNGPWYLGRPIMIRENDASKELFNGDMGICSSLDPVCVRFKTLNREQNLSTTQSVDEAASTAAKGIGWKEFPASSLPLFELGYALTIHKSQGSEYDHVYVILSPTDSLLHTRELLYTAVTRARKSVTIIATEAQLEKAVSTTKMRRSGLQSKL